jgi:hypothetical protein
MSHEPWNDITRKRFYAIPLELAFEALLYEVPIGETCCEALRQAILEKQQRLGTTMGKDRQEI